MDIFLITECQVTSIALTAASLPPKSFLWLDATHQEVAADLDGWRDAIERTTGTRIYDLHLSDATNLAHPSYFDATHDYEMVVFRKLSVASQTPANGLPAKAKEAGRKHRAPPALEKMTTQPVTFFLLDRALVTVRAEASRTVEAMRARLLDYQSKPEGGTHASRLPAAPAELMLRLLNAMVDQYLALRQPLTTQLDRWQRALLDPRRPFKDWLALLDARIELRRLDHLCEEQHDALQELRDHFIELHDGTDKNRGHDLLMVRLNDVMEHITRVLNHARRLESSIESAVQIHFSAVAHRTSEIMRTLTVITALFMPLTLITGIFGMNFNVMPLLQNPQGFWISMGLMACIVVLLLLYFRSKRYLEDRAMTR